jgi:Fe-S-cluster containining protein
MYVIDPNEVVRLAALQSEPNAKLKVRIKRIPARQLDEAVAAIAKDVIAAIDCTQCANCCKTLEPELAESEIERLAQHRQETRAAFEKKFLGYDSHREVHYLKPVCTFLRDNRCTAYAERPDACREYPRLLPDLKFRWKKTMQDYELCPIVFNTIELLRAKLDSENIPQA